MPSTEDDREKRAPGESEDEDPMSLLDQPTNLFEPYRRLRWNDRVHGRNFKVFLSRGGCLTMNLASRGEGSVLDERSEGGLRARVNEAEAKILFSKISMTSSEKLARACRRKRHACPVKDELRMREHKAAAQRGNRRPLLAYA